jgi:hypothetical protein
MRTWAKIKWAFGWPSRLFRLLVRRVDVLVVGAAHIETIGEVEDSISFAQGNDHEGRIVYSVGGGGYNIAVNLAAAGNGVRVALDTLLPKESRLAELVMAKLVFNGVALDYVRRLSVKNEANQGFVQAAMGGQVEVRAHEETMFSVSRTLVNTPEFWARNRDRFAVNRTKALVVDTHLLEAAAVEIVQRAVAKRTPLFVFVATDSTARRFARNIAQRTFSAEGAVLCLAGTAGVIEAMALEIDGDERKHVDRIRVLRSQSKLVDPRVVEGVCKLLKVRYVACIYDLKATILAWNGDYLQIDTSDLGSIRNQKGCSDALMAAIIDVFLAQGGRSVGSAGAQEILDLKNRRIADALNAEVRHHVGRAVSTLGATPGSVISFEEPFDTWGRLFERQIKYLVTQGTNALGWLAIIWLIDLAARLLAIEHIVRIPFRKLGAILGTLGQWLKTLLGLLFGH